MATVNATRPPVPKATFRIVLTEQEALSLAGVLGTAAYGGPTQGVFNALDQAFDELKITAGKTTSYLAGAESVKNAPAKKFTTIPKYTDPFDYRF